MVISTLSGLSQLHLFRGFYCSPLQCICSGVSIVAQLAFSGPLNWLSQLQAFCFPQCTSSDVVTNFQVVCTCLYNNTTVNEAARVAGQTTSTSRHTV